MYIYNIIYIYIYIWQSAFKYVRARWGFVRWNWAVERNAFWHLGYHDGSPRLPS